MADQTTDSALLNAVQRAAGDSTTPPEATGTNALIAALDSVAGQTHKLGATSQELSQVLALNTQAVAENTSTQGLKSAAADVAKGASSLLTSGLGLAPLFTSLFQLFGGGGQAQEPPTLAKYIAPSAVRIQAANGPLNEGLAPLGYGQEGLPRRADSVPAAVPQVTIQVQAMDSRSFLDRSDDIAKAVREALLNMHSLGDVIRDL